MANQQGDQNTNRTIIIPKGVLDPNQVNIINIPRRFNSSAPLLVTPRRDGKGLKSQTLPIWKDELTGAGVYGNRRHDMEQKLIARGNASSAHDSGAYDSSGEMVMMDPKDFFAPQKESKGEYYNFNVVKKMTPSPKRPWPKLPESRPAQGFKPRFKSTPQQDKEQYSSEDSTLPSTMYSHEFVDPDEVDDSDCFCPEDKVAVTQNLSFSEPPHPNATYDQQLLPNATYNQQIFPDALYNQQQQPNDQLQCPGAAPNQAYCPDGTFSLAQNPNEGYEDYYPDDAYMISPQQYGSTDNTQDDDSRYYTAIGSPNETSYYSGEDSSAARSGNFYSACGGAEDLNSARILQASCRSFTQINDNPPESRSMSVDAPEGISEAAMKYATRMATFGDSGSRQMEDFNMSGGETTDGDMRYATQMATFGDSELDSAFYGEDMRYASDMDGYYADQSYQSPPMKRRPKNLKGDCGC